MPTGSTNAMTRGGGTSTPTQTKEVQATAFPTVVTPDSGYALSQATVTAPANLSAENIKKDVTIAGVTGSFQGTEVQVENLQQKFIYEVLNGKGIKVTDPITNVPGLNVYFTINGFFTGRYIDSLDLSNCTFIFQSQTCNRIYQFNSKFTGSELIKISSNYDMYFGFSYSNLIGVPIGFTKLGAYSFSNSAFNIDTIELTNENISDGIIPNGAFANIHYLTYSPTEHAEYKPLTIILPDNIVTIKDEAISGYGNTAPVTIKIKTITPPTLTNSTSISNAAKIIVPVGSLANYQSATNWSQFADIMEEATA